MHEESNEGVDLSVDWDDLWCNALYIAERIAGRNTAWQFIGPILGLALAIGGVIWFAQHDVWTNTTPVSDGQYGSASITVLVPSVLAVIAGVILFLAFPLNWLNRTYVALWLRRQHNERRQQLSAE